MSELPMAIVATDDEVLNLIEREKLCGRGVGYIDAHLLAATQLSETAPCGRAIAPCATLLKLLD